MALPAFGILLAIVFVATLIHLLSSLFNRFVTVKRLLLGYFGIALVLMLVVHGFDPMLFQRVSQFELMHMLMSVFGFGLYLAISFRALDFTIGRLLESDQNNQ